MSIELLHIKDQCQKKAIATTMAARRAIWIAASFPLLASAQILFPTLKDFFQGVCDYNTFPHPNAEYRDKCSVIIGYEHYCTFDGSSISYKTPIATATFCDDGFNVNYVPLNSSNSDLVAQFDIDFGAMAQKKDMEVNKQSSCLAHDNEESKSSGLKCVEDENDFQINAQAFTGVGFDSNGNAISCGFLEDYGEGVLLAYDYDCPKFYVVLMSSNEEVQLKTSYMFSYTDQIIDINPAGPQAVDVSGKLESIFSIQKSDEGNFEIVVISTTSENIIARDDLPPDMDCSILATQQLGGSGMGIDEESCSQSYKLDISPDNTHVLVQIIFGSTNWRIQRFKINPDSFSTSDDDMTGSYSSDSGTDDDFGGQNQRKRRDSNQDLDGTPFNAFKITGQSFNVFLPAKATFKPNGFKCSPDGKTIAQEFDYDDDENSAEPYNYNYIVGTQTRDVGQIAGTYAIVGFVDPTRLIIQNQNNDVLPIDMTKPNSVLLDATGKPTVFGAKTVPPLAFMRSEPTAAGKTEVKADNQPAAVSFVTVFKDGDTTSSATCEVTTIDGNENCVLFEQPEDAGPNINCNIKFNGNRVKVTSNTGDLKWMADCY